MGRHREQVGRRRAARPRYDRIGAATVSLAITAVALLAGVGIIPVGGAGSAASAEQDIRMALDHAAPTPAEQADARARPEEAPLPRASGKGKRVVFSLSDQRIWLVTRSGEVLSTYLASGSLTDNLEPGTYSVYSRSRHATGIDDSGTMEYFVRFTRGQRAAIGFHSIPVKGGQPLQTVAELGTPTSHGCIRQEITDAKRLWGFAPDGTTVVVTA